MNPWWWLPIGLAAWLVVGLAVALCLGPVLKRSSEAGEALRQQLAKSGGQHQLPWRLAAGVR